MQISPPRHRGRHPKNKSSKRSSSVPLCLCASVSLCLCVSVPLCLCVSVVEERQSEICPLLEVVVPLVRKIEVALPAKLLGRRRRMPRQLPCRIIGTIQEEVCCIELSARVACNRAASARHIDVPHMLIVTSRA